MEQDNGWQVVLASIDMEEDEHRRVCAHAWFGLSRAVGGRESDPVWCVGGYVSANWQCCVFNCLFSLPPLPALPFQSECTSEVPQCYAAGGARTTCPIPWGNPQYWSIELTLSLRKSEQTDMRHKDATDWEGTCVLSSAHVHTACLTVHCVLLCWSSDVCYSNSFSLVHAASASCQQGMG